MGNILRSRKNYQMTTIEQIKEECRHIIALAGIATQGPWMHDTSQGHVGDVCTPDTDSIAMTQERIEIAQRYGDGHRTEQIKQRNINAAFIAASRSFTPKAAQAVLVMIEGLELVAYMREDGNKPDMSFNGMNAAAALATLCATWEGSK